MGQITICFGLTFTVGGVIPDDIEEQYTKNIKTIFSYLYKHESLSMTVFIPGLMLEWFEKNHPEIMDLLSLFVKRKQVEMIGGGYYEPLFPLLLPVDKVGQIESLTTSIRKTTGRKPRGIYMAESVWDPSLISSCKTCGIEYAVLDSRLIPQSSYRPVSTYKPLIIEDMGRTITVIPLHQDCVPSVTQKPESFMDYIKNNKIAGQDSIHSCFFTPGGLAELLQTGWMDSFIDIVSESSDVAFSVPQKYLKYCTSFTKTYIPAGCMSDAAMWTLEPFVPHSKVFSEALRPTIRDFLNLYPEAQKIYSRMMYVSAMVANCHGDKMRKKVAREYLWAAQNYAVYMFTGQSGIADRKLRNKCYENLLNAEKMLREISDFIENSKSFDLDFDGTKEYVNSFNTYNAFISLNGGVLSELDIIQNCANYCNTMQRVRKYDGVTDFYAKNMFVDHFVVRDDGAFSENDISPLNTLPTQMYKEIQFERLRHEILLRTEFDIVVGEEKVSLSLLKKYLLTENGIQVQYIIKNASSVDVHGYFAVENNFSIPLFNTVNPAIEVVCADECEIPCIDQLYMKQSNVSLMQLTDVSAGNSFVLEPNEKSGICLYPYKINRPDSRGTVKEQYEANSCVIFWEISIPAQKEIEKTVYLGIKTTQKKSVAKRIRKQ